MRIVPRHKQDFDACSALSVAEDSEVLPKLHELLTWLQNMNWPVAALVEGRIKSVGAPLVGHVREVLGSSDNIWKYWVVSSLLPQVPASVVESLRPELSRIVASPSEGERKEGVVDAIRSLLGR